MKTNTNVTTNFVDIFENGATFRDKTGVRYIVLRESDPKKRIFTVLRISAVSVGDNVEVETHSSVDLMKLEYIGTAEINLDIKITDTTGRG